MSFLPLLPAFGLFIRAALAAGLSVAIAQLLRLQFPLYALIAMAGLDPALYQSGKIDRKGKERSPSEATDISDG